jgi:hypothetical protein
MMFFCSCPFWEVALSFSFLRYYFSDERLLFLLTLFFILDASSLFLVVLNFLFSLHPYHDEDACKI